MTAAFWNALGAKSTFLRVERRLIDAGSVVELDILYGMSADEIDLMVLRERRFSA